MEQRFYTRSRSARLAGFLTGARIHLLLCSLLIPGLVVLTTSCSDSEPGNNHDGGLDAGDGGLTDAIVDNGPLDCGVRPADGSVCVTGRLYDFQTDELVTPGVENEIFSFYNGTDMLAVRDAPDTYFGRVAPSGRYMTWTNDQQNDRCLALLADIDGHMPATINCYTDSFGLHPDYPGEHRYYLISETAYASWVSSYPGEPDLQNDRPLILGQCRTADWTQVDSGDFHINSSDFSYPWPQHCYPFNEDRLDFIDMDDNIGSIHPGGAFLYFVPLEFNGVSREILMNLDFDCPGDFLPDFEVGRYDTEWGGIDFAILNNVPF